MAHLPRDRPLFGGRCVVALRFVVAVAVALIARLRLSGFIHRRGVRGWQRVAGLTFVLFHLLLLTLARDIRAVRSLWAATRSPSTLRKFDRRHVDIERAADLQLRE